ncbi:unnamed protein product, partial [Candidula unifasciata]
PVRIAYLKGCTFVFAVPNAAAAAAAPKIFGNFSATSTPITTTTAKTSLNEKAGSPLADQKLQGAVQKVPASIIKSPAGGEQDHVEEYEPNVDFKPVIALPELVEKKTGEENEIEVFVDRCRLFRFDPELKQWKERGIGEIKILQSKDLVKFRIVMRREQILKLCANHFLTADMKLTPMAASDRAWCYFANDFSEEEIKHEHLAVKFKTAEKAKVFQEKFDECCKQLKDETAVTSTSSDGGILFFVTYLTD